MSLLYAFKKPNTGAAVKVEFGLFLKHLGAVNLADVTRQEANRVVAEIMKTGLSPKYWKNILGCVKGFFKWVVEEGLRWLH